MLAKRVELWTAHYGLDTIWYDIGSADVIELMIETWARSDQSSLTLWFE